MKTPYSTEQLQFIEQHCTLEKNKLANECNLRFGTDKSGAALASIRKKHGWKTGRTGRFQKGNIPAANARPKGANATSFKKGAKPHNWLPVGTERVNGNGYVDIKISEPNVWVFKQRLVWEENFGPVPDGMLVIFKDNDNRNFSPDNLDLITRDQLLCINRNQVSALPADLKPLMLNVSKIEAETFKRQRKQGGLA